jgi:hypothetical protein
MTLGLVLTLSLVLTAPSALAQGQAKISKLGQYSGYSELRYVEWVRTSQYVAVRDGTRLAVDIFRPAQNGQPVDEKLPVIWVHHRYHRADLSDGKLYTVLDQQPWLKTVLQHGYIVAAVDARGSGASFGTRHGELTPEEALDAYDITEWFAAQPWCDGSVGMFGLSYQGAAQLMAASTAPPHLKAIFPEKASVDIYEMAYPGGVFHHDFAVGWSGNIKRLDRGGTVAPTDDDSTRSLLNQALAQHQSNVDVLALVAALPYRNSRFISTDLRPYMQWGVSNHISEINQSHVAVYLLAGWYDAFVRDDLLTFGNLQTPRKLVIGPWSHTDSHGLDLAAEHLRWYDYWLKGIDNGVMSEPPIYYYTMGATPGQEWRAAQSLPLPNEQRTRYYLQAGPSSSVKSVNDGLLDTHLVSDVTGQDSYTVDYTTTSGNGTRWTNAYGGPFHYRDMTPNDQKGLTYTSPPLPVDVEVTGHPLLHLWISCTAKNVDVFAYLEEVEANGRSYYITEGVLRASHRAVSTPLFNYMGLPYHRSFREDVADLPAEPVELVFDLLPTSNIFDAGHRIRLTITCADKDNALTPMLSPPPVLNVYRNATHASYLDLPLIAETPTPAPLPTSERTATPLLTPTPLPSQPPVGPTGSIPLALIIGVALLLLLAVALALLLGKRQK